MIPTIPADIVVPEESVNIRAELQVIGMTNPTPTLGFNANDLLKDTFFPTDALDFWLYGDNQVILFGDGQEVQL